MYDYKVLEVVRVVDGDTLDMRIDVGFHLSAVLRFRLLVVNTPERGEPGWAEATAYTKGWIEGRAVDELIAYTSKSDSFGRWLVTLSDGQSTLNDALLSSGMATPWVRK